MINTDALVALLSQFSQAGNLNHTLPLISAMTSFRKMQLLVLLLTGASTWPVSARLYRHANNGVNEQVRKANRMYLLYVRFLYSIHDYFLLVFAT